MKKIFIDSEFKCHVTDDGTGKMTAIETDFFDGMCDEVIEGHRLVPAEKNWTRSDGMIFTDMVAPWRDSKELDSIQREYERERLADAESALAILYGGTV